MTHIPIVLFNRDRLDTTEKLVDHLRILGYDSIYIYDIGSTYPPLLEWYKTCPHIQVIHCTDTSTGHKAFWNTGAIEQFSVYPWIAVSDSDIELNTNTPSGFIEQLIAVAKDFRTDKAGLAIAYEDISNQYLRHIILPIESRYWSNRLSHHTWICYNAPVDTTFCVVRTDRPFTYRSVRVAGEMTCRHVDWYSDWTNLSDEENYYMVHADENISTTKQHFLKFLMTNG